MNEEEKKAIEWLKNKPQECTDIIRSCSNLQNKKAYAKNRTMYKALINFIDKQQEEIKKHEENELILCMDIEKQQEKVKQQQKEIEELQEDKKALVDNYSKVLSSFISKDKIKELKEKVENEQISNPYDFSYMINELLEEQT